MLCSLLSSADSAVLTSVTFRQTWKTFQPFSKCWFSLWKSTPSQYIFIFLVFTVHVIFLSFDWWPVIDWMDAWTEFGLTGQFVSDRHFFLLWTLLVLLNKVWLLYLQVVNYTCSICFSELWLSYNFSIAFLKHAQYSDELPMFTSCCTKITQTSSCPEWTFMLAIIVTTATSIGHMKSYNRFFQFGQVHNDDNDFFGGNKNLKPDEQQQLSLCFIRIDDDWLCVTKWSL